MEALRTSGCEDTGQAFGELLVVRHALYPDEEWASEELEAICQGRGGGELIEGMRLGVAIAASEWWGEQRRRRRANDILLSFAGDPDRFLCGAILRAAYRARSIEPDGQFWRYVRSITDQPHILKHENISFLLEAVANHVPVDPDATFSLCLGVIKEVGAQLGDIRYGHALSADPLVAIVAAFHQLDEANRIRAVDLLERLTELGVTEAAAFVEEFDRLPSRTPAQRPPRRRRRRSRRR
jgi:hypothetical protein